MVDDNVQLAFPARVERLRDALANVLEAMAPESEGSPLAAAKAAAEQELAAFDQFIAEAAKDEDMTKRRTR
jgi:hypothetical protein